MKKGIVIFFLSTVILAACGEKRMPGFRRLSNGSYFKLMALGESDRKPREGEYLEMVILNTFADSVLYNSRLESSRGTMITPYNDKDGFAKLHEGDSADFLIPAYDLMPYGNDTMMHMHVKLVHIFDEKQYKAESEKRAHVDEMDEQKILSYFLKTSKVKYEELGKGLYYSEEIKGKGKSVERGDRVLVNYQGTFLNGKKFDVTAEPVEYTLGDEGQLIEGMALALAHMREGGKAKIIIPSHLAYGAEGSSTGIIKPFTSIQYKIELVKVN